MRSALPLHRRCHRRIEGCCLYDYELVRGGKHWQVQWARKDGARRFYVLPGTPWIGDQRVTCELISAGC